MADSKSVGKQRLITALKIILIIGLIAAAMPLVIQIVSRLIPIINSVIRGGDPQQIKTQLRSFGWEGIIVMTLLQAFQTLTIILPSPVVWLIGGITYGPLGILICIVGMGLANMLTFSMSKKHGTKLISKIAGKKNARENLLAKSRHPALLVALVYFIPGFPNGIIPYLAGVTSLTRKQFLLSSTLALLPSLICFIYMGDNIMTGNITAAIVLAVVVAVISVICFIFKKPIIEKFEKITGKNSNNQ